MGWHGYQSRRRYGGRRDEVKGIREVYQKFGDKLPRQLSEELDILDARLN